MSRIYHDCTHPVYLFCDRLLASIVYAFASYTLCYQFAVLFKLSLKFLTIVFLVAATAIFLFILLAHSREFSKQFRSDDRHLWMAVMLGTIAGVCGLLSLLTSRPDNDDADYLLRAVYNFENWSQPLLAHPPFAFVSNETPTLWSMANAYENLCASLAIATGVKPIHIYHFAVPFFAGALVPVVWYLLLSRLSGSPCAGVIGAVAVVLVLCADGSRFHSVGNWAFVRMYPGKCILMTIVTPLCIKYLLEAFNASSISAYMRIAALSVASLGLSMMSFFYLPFLFGAVAISYYLAEFPKTPLRKIVMTGAVLSAYLLVWAPAYYWIAQGQIAECGFESQWPNDLQGIAPMVFGQLPGITGTIALVCLGILAGLKQWRVLCWLFIWTAVIVIPLSFKPISSLVSTYLTSRNAFWRILYILPTLLCIGVAVAELYKRFSRHNWAIGCVAGALILTVVFLNTTVAGIGPWAKKGVSFPVLGVKRPEASLTCSQAIINTLDPGPMMAAEEIALTLPVLSSRFAQCYLRHFEQYSGFGDRQTMLRRFAAHNFMAGRTTSKEALVAFIEEISYPYKYVILPLDVSGRQSTLKALANAGFVFVAIIGDKYKIFERK